MLIPSQKGEIETKTWNARFLSYDNDMMSGFHVHQNGKWAFIPHFTPDFRRVITESREDAEDGIFYDTREYSGPVNFDITPHSHVAEVLGEMVAETAVQMAREAAYGLDESFGRLRQLSSIVGDSGTNSATLSQAEAEIDQILDEMPRLD